MFVKYNGKWLDSEIKGMRVVSVTGRELMSRDIDEHTVSGIDGAYYIGSTLPTRDIKVSFQLEAPTKEAYRIRFNKLNALLKATQAQLIFADELDKYFVASVAECDANTITFHCTDPLKYATVLSTATFTKSGNIMVANVTNNGNVPVNLEYNLTMGAENGYVGIVSKEGAIQLGSKSELDTDTREKSVDLFNYTSGSAIFSAGTKSTDALWPSITCPDSLASKTEGSDTYTALGSYSANNSLGWHGGSLIFTVPSFTNASGSGQYPTNWKLSSRIWFESGTIYQTGMMAVACYDASKNLICKFNVNKHYVGNNDATVHMSSDGNGDFNTYDFQPGYWSGANKSGGWITIQKSGNLFEFNVFGKKYQSRVPANASKILRYVRIFIGNYAGRTDHMSCAYFRQLSLRADNVSYIYDVPNRFRSGDRIYIDGTSSKVYVNDVYRPQDEVLGTSYFKAPANETLEVQLGVSTWSSLPTTATVKWREAWL